MQRKLGMLKDLATKSSSVFTDYDDLALRMKEGMALLELTYSTSGISPPRKGDGVFFGADPLPFTAFYFGTSTRHHSNMPSDILPLTLFLGYSMQTRVYLVGSRVRTRPMVVPSNRATTCCDRCAVWSPTFALSARHRRNSPYASRWRWLRAVPRPRFDRGVYS